MTNDLSGVYIDRLEVASQPVPEPTTILFATSGLLAICAKKRLS